MKFRNLLFTCIIGAVSLATAQSAPRPPQRGTEGSSEDRTRMQQHMQSMQKDLAKMRSLLDQMKTNTAAFTGKEKAAMEANVQLWQMMVDHMSQMAEHMQSMQGHGAMGMSGHSGMHHGTGGSHDHGNMQGPASAAPSAPTSNNPPTPPNR
jgi:hypothetical protein